MTKKKIIVIILVLAAVAAASASAIRYVPEGQVGVVRTAGTVRHVQPGILFLNPFRESLDRIPTERLQLHGIAEVRSVDGFMLRLPFRAGVELQAKEYDAVVGDRGGLEPAEDITRGLAAGISAWGATFSATDFLTRELGGEAEMALRGATGNMGILLKEFALDRPDPDLYLLLAEDALGRGEPEPRIDLIESALQREPDDWRLLTARGMLFEAAGDHAAAEQLYLSALNSRPGAEPPLGRLYLRLLAAGQNFRLQRLLTDASAANPGSSKIHNWLALTYIPMGAGAYADALQHLERARELAPGDIATLTNLAGIYQKSGRFDAAAEIYRDLLEQHGDSQMVLLNLGLAEIGRGDLTAARDALQRALSAGPGSIQLHNLLADVYRRSGMEPKTIEQLQASFALDPAQPGLRDALTRLLGHPPEQP